MKVLSVFGTRPEAIKMAPVVQELARHPEAVCSRVCVTGQHREMLDQVLGLFGIVPDCDLDLMEPGQSLSRLTARLFAALGPVIEEEQPDWILVQGDTTTAMAAALAAFYRKVRVAHVEAGLRTMDKYQPFPEEINRRIAGVVADLHFAPSKRARDNLLRENVLPEQIVVTGNTVVDALQWVRGLPFDRSESPLAGIPWNQRLILVTAHRRENWGAPLERVCRALLRLAQVPGVHIVFPVHPNPLVQDTVYSHLAEHPSISLLPPLQYQPLVQLMASCYLVLTDSGGLQEEAPSLGKPVLVLRHTTERPEGVEAGNALLVGTEPDAILGGVTRLLDEPKEYERMARVANPYGDGRAAQAIVAALLAFEGNRVCQAD